MYRLIKELEACHRNMVKAGIGPTMERPASTGQTWGDLTLSGLPSGDSALPGNASSLEPVNQPDSTPQRTPTQEPEPYTGPVRRELPASAASPAPSSARNTPQFMKGYPRAEPTLPWMRAGEYARTYPAPNILESSTLSELRAAAGLPSDTHLRFRVDPTTQTVRGQYRTDEGQWPDLTFNKTPWTMSYAPDAQSSTPYDNALRGLIAKNQIPAGSYLDFGNPVADSGSLPVCGPTGNPIGAIRGDGGWMPFTGTAQQTESIPSFVPNDAATDVYASTANELVGTEQIPSDSYLDFNSQNVESGTVPVRARDGRSLGYIDANGTWHPLGNSRTVTPAVLPKPTPIDGTQPAVNGPYTNSSFPWLPYTNPNITWSIAGVPASTTTQEQVDQIPQAPAYNPDKALLARQLGFGATADNLNIQYNAKAGVYEICLPDKMVAATYDPVSNKTLRTQDWFNRYYTEHNYGGGVQVVTGPSAEGSQPNLYRADDASRSYPVATYDPQEERYAPTAFGQELQRYNKIEAPYYSGGGIQTRAGMANGLPALFDASSDAKDPNSEPLYIWDPEREEFIVSPTVVTNWYNRDGRFTFDDNARPIPVGDGKYKYVHPGDTDGRYPTLVRSQNGVYRHEPNWYANPTTGQAQYTPNGFTRAQIHDSRFQELTPEEALFQTGKLNTVRAEISKMPNAKLSWNDTNGITVINAVTKRPMGTVEADGNVEWNKGINVGNTTATAPQDIWTAVQGLASTEAIDINDFVNQNEDGSISIYSPVSGTESTLRPAISGGYEFQSGSSDAPTITPITPAGEVVDQTTAAKRLQQVSRGYNIGTYDPNTGLYPVLDEDSQPAGNFNPYTGMRTWNTPVDPATATLPLEEEVAEDAEPKVDAPTLSNALQDPKVMEYLAYGIPIGAALGLAGYAVGGAKPGTLLPYLLGGAGGGALLGGMYGHYYGGEGTGTDTTEALSAEALAALPEDQRIAILENRRWKEGVAYDMPITAKDVQNYSYAYVPKIGEFTYAEDDWNSQCRRPNDLINLPYTQRSPDAAVQNYLQDALPFADLCMRNGGPVQYLGCRRTEDGANNLFYKVRDSSTGRPCILHAKYIDGDANRSTSYHWKKETAAGTFTLSLGQVKPLFMNSFKGANPGDPFQPENNADNTRMNTWLNEFGIQQ